ncbi:hypothetical protein GCM10009587_14720 [Microbacterium maritypicum]
MSTVDEADTGDHAGSRRLSPIQSVGGERGDLEERTALIEHTGDAVAREHLPAGDVPFAGSFWSAARRGREARSQLVRQ